MFNPRHTLKTSLLCLATLYGAALAAQSELRIAVVEPVYSKQTRAQSSLVRNAFVQAASETRGYQVFDRSRTDQILQEHGFQNNGLVAPKEARELGKMLGVDLICTSEVQMLHDAYEISASLIDIVTGENIGSKSELVETHNSREMQETCKDMMSELLKLARAKAPTTFDRGGGGGGKSSSAGASSAGQMGADLDAEIARSIKNFKSNAKWNRIKATCDIEVDLSGLDIKLNRQYGTTYHVAQGTINVSATDVETGNEASVELAIVQVTDMNKENMKKKVRDQINIGNLIKELLSEME